MKLRNLFFIIVALVCLSSCYKSNENKAQEMAAEYLKGVLFHYDSYEPLVTKVDSAYFILSNDKDALQLIENMTKTMLLAQEYQKKVEMAERSMDIWSPDSYYSSRLSAGNYKRAEKERDNNQALLEQAVEKIKSQFEDIKSIQSKLNPGEFKGWKVYHKFKSLDGTGTVDLHGEYILFCDDEFNLEVAYKKEDYDAMSIILEVVAKSDDIMDMTDNLQLLM